MLLDREAVGRVVEILDAECFYHQKHQTMFAAMIALFERGITIDMITLSNDLQRSGELERVGGMRMLADLSIKTVSAANVEYHARIVLERFLKRQLISVASEIINDSFDESTDALDEVDRAEQRIFEVAERRTRRSYSDMKKLTKHAVERIVELAEGSGDGVTGVPGSEQHRQFGPSFVDFGGEFAAVHDQMPSSNSMSICWIGSGRATFVDVQLAAVRAIEA